MVGVAVGGADVGVIVGVTVGDGVGVAVGGGGVGVGGGPLTSAHISTSSIFHPQYVTEESDDPMIHRRYKVDSPSAYWEIS